MLLKIKQALYCLIIVSMFPMNPKTIPTCIETGSYMITHIDGNGRPVIEMETLIYQEPPEKKRSKC